MTSSIIVQINTPITLPDGTHLATDIYRPAHREPIATLLLRTPYSKTAHLAEGPGWARQGFAFVAQDVRGRYDSDRDWHPYVHEREDSATVVDWLAQQPWCRQRIVAYGGSYSAFTAWTVALSKHPAVQAAIIQVPAMGTHAVNFGNNGILQLYNHTWWWVNHAEGRTTRTALCEKMMSSDPEMLSLLPVVDLPQRFWVHLANWCKQATASPDELPAYTISDEEIASLVIPVLHIGGWHDLFLEQTLHQWQIARSGASSHAHHALIVGPWSHDLEFGEPASCGERSYGPASQFPLGRLLLQWLRHLFPIPLSEQGAQARHIPSPPALQNTTEPVANVSLSSSDASEVRNPFAQLPVTFFVTGKNQWFRENTWPPGNIHPVCWYAGVDNCLLAELSQDDGALQFSYDPRDPFPSRSFPVDRRDLFERQDAVRFLTPPLYEALTYIGAPVVTLYAMTDAPDTDWVASLQEMTSDSRLLYLGHALVNARRANAVAGISHIPNTVYKYRLSLRPLAITLPMGHRLCLEITSSDFPQHARNLNTGQNRYTTSETRRATQTILYGRQTPTSVTLPCVFISTDNNAATTS